MWDEKLIETKERHKHIFTLLRVIYYYQFQIVKLVNLESTKASAVGIVINVLCLNINHNVLLKLVIDAAWNQFDIYLV